jgi:uncharacterized membrane protein YcaP (DUF421 family)
MNELLMVVVRSVIVYLFIILGIRLFGKKEVTQLSIIDLVFILLISNSVQNAMVGGNTSLLAGITAAASLFILNYVLDSLFFHSRELSRLVEGNSLMLVYKGKVMKKHLNEARITMEELNAVIREHGVENVSQVDLAILETDGNISVLSDNFRRRTVRRRKAHKALSGNE